MIKSSVQKIIKALGQVPSPTRLYLIENYVSNKYSQVKTYMDQNQHQQNAKQIKNYMKSDLKFYGLVTNKIHSIIKDTIHKKEDFDFNFALSERMIKSDMFELRTGGIDILTECHSKIDIAALPLIRELIDDGWISCWAHCDSLALPLKLASLKQGEKFDDCLVDWKYDPNIWVRRAALVTFIKRASHGDKQPNYKGFTDKLFGMCEECVKYDHRFNQLAVGWLLRELSLTDKEAVKKFLHKHYEVMSRQAIRSAIEKMPPEERKEILKHKLSVSKDTKQRRARSSQPPLKKMK